jgi:hypothetical protein
LSSITADIHLWRTPVDPLTIGSIVDVAVAAGLSAVGTVKGGS